MCRCVWLCKIMCPDAYRIPVEQKRAWDPLELELHRVVSYYCWELNLGPLEE